MARTTPWLRGIGPVLALPLLLTACGRPVGDPAPHNGALSADTSFTLVDKAWTPLDTEHPDPAVERTLLAASATASHILATIKGQKSGFFKGDGDPKSPDKIRVLGFGYSVISPRDPASGLPTGKRLHKPITLTKEWGASSPQLFNALTSNENLASVLLEFQRTTPRGEAETFYTVKLTNAGVASLEQAAGSAPNPFGSPTGISSMTLPDNGLETVSLTFQKIEVQYTKGAITASDSWSTSSN